jgi:putative GTP pyrophosphokinase
MVHQESPDFVAEFAANRPRYEDFARQCADRVRSALLNNDVEFFAVEHRAKSVASFREKLGRPGKSYFDPFYEMPDLAGVRVILNYLPDVDRVVELCGRLFAINEENSVRASDRLGTEEFGYQSTHIVGWISEQRRLLDEWQPYEDMQVEIQVRTVLQHAWASVSHALQYKREADVPRKLRRRLARVAASLETADTEFSELAVEHRQLLLDANEAIDQDEQWDAPVDTTTIKAFIEKGSEPSDLIRVALSIHGFSDGGDKISSIGDLVRVCDGLSIRTLKELRQLIAKAQPRYERFLREAILRSEFSSWSIDSAFAVTLAIILAKADTPKLMAIIRAKDDDWENADFTVRAARAVSTDYL